MKKLLIGLLVLGLVFGGVYVNKPKNETALVECKGKPNNCY